MENIVQANCFCKCAEILEKKLKAVNYQLDAPEPELAPLIKPEPELKWSKGYIEHKKTLPPMMQMHFFYLVESMKIKQTGAIACHEREKLWDKYMNGQHELTHDYLESLWSRFSKEMETTS